MCGTYSRPGCSFGRCPIVIHLGDFLQLSPTAALSLVTDVNAKNEDGSYVFEEPPDLEIQNAIKLFSRIPCVIELQGTKRFVPGDPLIQLLQCMRRGTRIPDFIWSAFEKTFVTDSHPDKTSYVFTSRRRMSDVGQRSLCKVIECGEHLQHWAYSRCLACSRWNHNFPSERRK